MRVTAHTRSIAEGSAEPQAQAQTDAELLELRGPIVRLADADREAWLALLRRGRVIRIDAAVGAPLAVLTRSAFARALAGGGDALPTALEALGMRLSHGLRETQRSVVVVQGISERAQRAALGPEDSDTLVTLCTLARAGAFDLALNPEDLRVDLHRIAQPFAEFVEEPAAENVHSTTVEERRENPGIVTPKRAATAPASTPQALPRPDLHAHARALVGATGPLSLAALERLFLEHYLPLARAVASGLAEPSAALELGRFRSNFADVYSEVAKTLPLRTKRPRMACDVLAGAAALARKHAARAVECVLVDGMRFDIGRAFEEPFRNLLGPAAELVERSILWAAMPTTTGRQLSLIAHGIDALRSEQFAEAEAAPQRERAAKTLRRIRVGNREIAKLDLLESMQDRLTEATFDVDALGLAVAEAVAGAVQSHALVRAERTLLCVFGDHGFAVTPQGARQGGATPEEVFVPCYSWIVEPLN